MKLLCISLGCDKNLVDTEMMLGLLNRDGYTFTDDEYEADVIVINTCCFIGDAKEESVNTILEMAQMKEVGKCKALIVTGCLAQRYKQEIVDEIPEVDGILGTTTYDEISHVLAETLDGREHVQCFHDLDIIPEVKTDRVITTGGHYAFLKIAEGCDKHCTYCIIPSLRGNFRSVPMERLVSEAQSLADQGVKELILVAQETTLYGVDLYGKKSLPELLKKLCRISGIQWIRIQYCYPEEITDELIQTMKTEEKICHYIDMPIQHASDTILRRMGRRTSRAQLKEMIGKLRSEIPDIAIRTTLISGFPGETEEDFLETLDVVRRVGFDSAFTFIYSKRTGTPAAAMEDQAPEDVVKERFDRLLKEVQDISAKVCCRDEHTVQEVLVEEVNDHSPGLMTGRLSNNTVVHFPGDASLIGKLVPVYLEESRGFYYMGKQADRPL